MQTRSISRGPANIILTQDSVNPTCSNGSGLIPSVTQSMAPKIRVGVTPNKGRGIFALREIKPGESIEEAPVVTIPESQVAQVDATTLGDYCFLWGQNLDELALL